VSPSSGQHGVSKTLTVFGEGFQEGLTAKLDNAPLENLYFTGDDLFTAEVPSTLEPGMYSLFATNPDGNSAMLADAYEVMGNVAPSKKGCDATPDGNRGLAVGLFLALYWAARWLSLRQRV
jgi:hypothetical protein